VRDVFDLSASDNMIAPPSSIEKAVWSENEMKCSTSVLPRSSEARDEVDLSASDNLITPSTPNLVPVMSENELKQPICYS
jgi:hypothetical protein